MLDVRIVDFGLRKAKLRFQIAELKYNTLIDAGVVEYWRNE
jgi:hypothetical protein